MLKGALSGLQHHRLQYGPLFIRLAIVASQVCEILPNSPKIRKLIAVQGHPRSRSWCPSKAHMRLAISHQ